MKLVGFQDGSQNIRKQNVFHFLNMVDNNISYITYSLGVPHCVPYDEQQNFMNNINIMASNHENYPNAYQQHSHIVKNPVYEVELSLVRNLSKCDSRLNITSQNQDGKPMFSIMRSGTSFVAEMIADLCLGEHEVINGSIIGTRRITAYNGGPLNSFRLYRGNVIPFVVN